MQCFKRLLEDLNEFKTYHLISNGSEAIKSFKSKSISITGDLKNGFVSNINQFDACIPIAPEENNLLYDLTRIIEEQDVEVIGSSSDAVKKTTNKFDTYNALKNKVSIIKTEKVYFDDSIKKFREQIDKFNNRFR